MTSKAFDIQYLREYTGLDIDTIKELKSVYMTSLEESSIHLNSLLASDRVDLDELYGIAHSTKGTAASVNDISLSEKSKDICDVIKLSDESYYSIIERASALLELLSDRLDELQSMTIS